MDNNRFTKEEINFSSMLYHNRRKIFNLINEKNVTTEDIEIISRYINCAFDNVVEFINKNYKYQ